MIFLEANDFPLRLQDAFSYTIHWIVDIAFITQATLSFMTEKF